MPVDFFSNTNPSGNGARFSVRQGFSSGIYKPRFVITSPAPYAVDIYEKGNSGNTGGVGAGIGTSSVLANDGVPRCIVYPSSYMSVASGYNSIASLFNSIGLNNNQLWVPGTGLVAPIDGVYYLQIAGTCYLFASGNPNYSSFFILYYVNGSTGGTYTRSHNFSNQYAGYWGATGVREVDISISTTVKLSANDTVEPGLYFSRAGGTSTTAFFPYSNGPAGFFSAYLITD